MDRSRIRPCKLAVLVLVVTAALGGTIAAQDASTDQAIAIFNHGQDLHEKGDLAGAIAEYDRALKAFPEFPEAEYQRALAELGLGNIAEAEASLRRAVGLKPEWSLAWGTLGDVLVRKYFAAPPAQRSDLYADTESVLTRALKLDPANVPAVGALVALQLNTNASRDALRETLSIVKGLTEGKMSPPASLWAARSGLENALGDRIAAKASAKRAIDADPRSTATRLLAADMAIGDGDLDRAGQIIADLKKSNADTSRLTLLDARIAAAEGRLSDALALLDKLPPGTPAADELRKQVGLSTTTDPADLEKQLAADQNNARILNRLCTLYRRQDPQKALDYCRRASEIEPTNLAPAAGYAAALVQAKQYPAAVAILKRLLAIAPDNSTLHANLATALFQLKAYPEALIEFEWLSTTDPKAAGPYLFLGIIHDEMLHYVDSLAAYEQYLKLADPVANKLDLEKVELRLPVLRRLVKDGGGKRH